jgi:hypothetical protein
MAIKTDLLELAGSAEDSLARVFGLVKPSTVVVSGRVSGSAFGAQFDHMRNLIFVDVYELKRWDDLEVVHTMGEEVGHALHFILRPELFRRAKPAKEAVIQAVEEGRYSDLLRDSLLCSNLIEMIGFLAGLMFLENRSGRDAAMSYRKRSEPYLEPWTMPDALSLIDEFTNLHCESVSKSIGKAPEAWRERAESARPNTLPKDANEVMIHLTHRLGHRLALDVHAQAQDRQEELFQHALRADTILDFYTSTGLPEQRRD